MTQSFATKAFAVTNVAVSRLQQQHPALTREGALAMIDALVPASTTNRLAGRYSAACTLLKKPAAATV
ncbi:MAG: hypothetical protein ACAF41_34215 (plasmid) [Leptolyngbya sp. BL-A-14]